MTKFIQYWRLKRILKKSKLQCVYCGCKKEDKLQNIDGILVCPGCNK